jgi:hypothetical protein
MGQLVIQLAPPPPRRVLRGDGTDADGAHDGAPGRSERYKLTHLKEQTLKLGYHISGSRRF